jgi:hypothetical protein
VTTAWLVVVALVDVVTVPTAVGLRVVVGVTTARVVEAVWNVTVGYVTVGNAVWVVAGGGGGGGGGGGAEVWVGVPMLMVAVAVVVVHGLVVAGGGGGGGGGGTEVVAGGGGGGGGGAQVLVQATTMRPMMVRGNCRPKVALQPNLSATRPPIGAPILRPTVWMTLT